MSKFINSKEAILSPLQLWQGVSTQVSVQETYDIKEYPVTNLFNEGPIHFKISPQPNGMLKDIDIVTTFKITENGEPIKELKNDLGIINNFANSLWELVEVRVDDRLDLMQSMRNSYAYQTFFNTVLNSETNRADYLFQNELFMMDEAYDKEDAEDTNILTLNGSAAAYDVNERVKNMKSTDVTWEYQIGVVGAENELSVPTKEHFNYPSALWSLVNDKSLKEKYLSPNPKNPAAGKRATRVNKGQSVTVNSKLHCPLFRTEKCLPTRLKIRVSLTKNSDDFLLLAPEGSKYQVMIEDIYLNVTYFRPIDVILNRVEEQLSLEAAPYFISKPEIILRPVTNANRIIRVNDLFHEKLPSYAFFALQKSSDFEGKRTSSPFVFIPFSKFQIYVNGIPHFVDPLEMSYNIKDEKKIYSENGTFIRQLYRTIGKEYKGDSFVTPKNFQLNFIVGVSFTADRSTTSSSYLNLQGRGSTNVELDIGYNTDIPNDLVLIVYALYNRQIQINDQRQFHIIE